MPLVLLILICVALGAARTHAAGVIEGIVPLTQSTAPAATSGRYQIKASGAIAPPQPATAIVYLEGSFPTAPATNTAPIMAQKDFQFSQSVLAVQKGATVQFPNMDDDYHNVFSYSKPRRFDLGRYQKHEQPPAVKFDQPGLVKLYCEIHEHMRASILVLDTPHFVTTDTNGVFRLTNIPPGQYTLKAWLNEKTILSQPIEVVEGRATTASFK